MSQKVFNKESFSLTRRQCACLLAHSFLGSLKRPDAVQVGAPHPSLILSTLTLTLTLLTYPCYP